ncbi:MAG: HD domain-containing protein [Nitrososphaera sp.]
MDSIMRKVMDMLEGQDPAHDFQHVMRVYKNAKLIGTQEGAIMRILLPAVLLHDIVVYPKGSDNSVMSPDDSADLAEKILQRLRYSQHEINGISYCIRAHSFSKRLIPASLEGRILQDADRLDALGAIGIARTFSVGGSEKRTFYNAGDPFCRSGRKPDDKQWTLDHFHTKLLQLKDLMHTRTAKRIAQQRTRFMMLFIRQLQKEI